MHANLLVYTLYAPLINREDEMMPLCARRGKANSALKNELVKAVGKSLMEGVGLNQVLTPSLSKLFPGDKNLGRHAILRANITPLVPSFYLRKKPVTFIPN
ncbi:hypothetical protein GOODEAATRI_006668 [Goodea atripinnis]|uniref:Uncharacterized protein n=1 Tax=Goodea atripinnis TaxID=208336 RepID=A0ABV0MFL5_9TELE